MSNKVTGNEPIHAFTVDKGTAVQINEGMTLRQKALLDFMCAFAQAGYLDDENIAQRADKLTTAYINKLNKEV